MLFLRIILNAKNEIILMIRKLQQLKQEIIIKEPPWIKFKYYWDRDYP